MVRRLGVLLLLVVRRLLLRGNLGGQIRGGLSRRLGALRESVSALRLLRGLRQLRQLGCLRCRRGNGRTLLLPGPLVRLRRLGRGSRGRRELRRKCRPRPVLLGLRRLGLRKSVAAVRCRGCRPVLLREGEACGKGEACGLGAAWGAGACGNP